MSMKVCRLSVLALTLALMASAPIHAAPAAQQPPNEADVDLRALERDILAQVNEIRTNPQALASALEAAKANATSGQYGLQLTLADGTKQWAQAGYLDSGTSTARSLQPMGALVWADGLAQATRKYVEGNPKSHFDPGTPSQRAAVYGGSSFGPAESINWGGATGLAQTYKLYIDSGVSSLGHRSMMIDPQYTHLGVGCNYPNTWTNSPPGAKTIACVLNYAQNWVEKDNLVKLEVGKQYAIREPSNTFRYFTYAGLKPNRWHSFMVCPDSMGGMSMPDPGADVTTVDVAAAEGLVATNDPCPTEKAAHGVLNNGASLPVGVAPAAGTVAAATRVATKPAGAAPRTVTESPASPPPLGMRASPTPLPTMRMRASPTPLPTMRMRAPPTPLPTLRGRRP